MRVIGLISGTSVDGIDAALVDLSGTSLDLRVELLAAHTYPYSGPVRSQIISLCKGEAIPLAELALLDEAIAQEFAQAALEIQRGQPAAELIGSHGQTVYHRPVIGDKPAYTLQLGRGTIIAQHTGLPTITNFRVADTNAGGEGAPLVSRVDICLFSHPQQRRCVQNIGGIANLTYLPPLRDAAQIGVGVQGWDTGPGNSLLDLAVQYLSGGQQSYDDKGNWAAQGTPCQALVEQWLSHPYFEQAPPKSTGRELFGWDYLQTCLRDAEPYHLSAEDFLATLTELTAASIVLNYRQFLPALPDQVLLCGGGVHNHYLKQRLATLLTPIPVLSTNEVGLSADAKEAIAFAVLGYWRSLGLPGNVPAVTGARREVLLGDLHTYP